MIRLEAVRYDADDVTGGGAPIVHDVSFRLARGELLLVRGPSGSGKSTLLHLLAGLLRPSSGTVWIAEQPVSRFTSLHRDLARRRVGLLPQKLHLVDWLDVRQNVALPLTARARVDPARIARLLRALDLDALAERRAAQLSGGERQRVALARALVTEAPVLLLDEPTAHQDDAHAATALDAIGREHDRGATIVVAAHDARVDHWARGRGPSAFVAPLRRGELGPIERVS